MNEAISRKANASRVVKKRAARIPYRYGNNDTSGDGYATGMARGETPMRRSVIAYGLL